MKINFPDKDGDKDDVAVFYAVGYAVNKWEHLESRMAELFCRIIGGDYLAAYRAYGTPVAFQARIQMLKAATEARLVCDKSEKEIFEKIEATLNKIDSLSGRRNEIAHGALKEHNTRIESMRGKVKEFSGFYWAATPYNTQKNSFSGGSKFFMNSQDIMRHAADFHAVRGEVNDLIDALPMRQGHDGEQTGDE